MFSGMCSIIRKDKPRCENKKRGFFRKEWFSWQLVENLTAISSIVILYIHNIAILIVITYLWYLVVLENKKYKLQKNT